MIIIKRKVIIPLVYLQLVFAQNFVGINTGFSLNSSLGNSQTPSLFFGRKIKQFSPYIGFAAERQFIDKKYDNESEKDYSDKIITATPTLGLFYFLKSRNYKPIININISKEIPISVIHNKAESEDEEDVEEKEEFYIDQNNNLVSNLLIGMKHEINNHLSICGEYGLNLLLYDYRIFDRIEYKHKLLTTKSSLSLIYYFNEEPN